MAARKNDKYIPLYIVAFFLVVFAVNGYFVYMATTTHTGLVTEHAYEKGLHYNKTIELAEAQDLLGVRADIKADENNIYLNLQDRDGRPLIAEVMAYIVRPNKGGYDFEVKFQSSEIGPYIAKLNFPLKGQWEITIVAKWDDKEFQHSKRVVIN